MYVNNIEPEMFLPPGSESFNHNAMRTTSSRSRSNNVNNNIVPVYNAHATCGPRPARYNGSEVYKNFKIVNEDNRCQSMVY